MRGGRSPSTVCAAGRVEDWRVSFRVRWFIHCFRSGPQSDSLDYVSSPRHLKPDVRFSRIRLSDKVSCVRPRKVTGPLFQPDQSQLLIEIGIREA